MTDDAIRLLSAIGDAVAGRRIGFGMRVAAVAAAFARHAGGDRVAIATAYYAGALHALGGIRIDVTGDARSAAIAAWDEPVEGAALARAIPGLPPGTADTIRWHRESFDGSGFPDRLRWGGIPAAAMALNAVTAFVGALDEAEAPSPPEAFFALAAEGGRRFSLDVVRDFRSFIAAGGAAPEPAPVDWTLDGLDPLACVRWICDEVDARDDRRAGRGARLERTVRAIGARLPGTLDVERAGVAARLSSLGRLCSTTRSDDFDPLSRLGREARAAEASAAERLVRAIPAFAPYGAIVGASAEWFDGSGLPDGRAGAAIDVNARVLAVAIAADALGGSPFALTVNGYPEPQVRIAAAAGTQFDPAIVEAYLAAEGSPA